MKEATGELNMTVVTVVAIAALLAFFYLVIWPNLQAGMALSSACSAANGQDYTTETEGGAKITCSKASNSCTYDYNGKTSTRACTDRSN